MAINLEDIGDIITQYNETLEEIKYELNETEKETIINAAAKYLTASSIGMPEQTSKKIELYNQKTDLIKNQAANDATNVALSILERIAEDADYSEPEHPNSIYDIETLESIFYKLIEEIDSTITDNLNEIKSAVEDLGLKPNITDLNQYKSLLPPSVKFNHYSKHDNPEMQRKMRVFVDIYDNAHHAYNIKKPTFEALNDPEPNESDTDGEDI